MSSIAVRSLPFKTEYTLGEALDLTGIALDAVYENGETLPLCYAAAADTAQFDTVGTQTVTVSYGGCSATFDVNVLLNPDAPMIAVSNAVVGFSAGRRVCVTVDLRYNPGIIATRLFLGYDPQQLRLVKAENGSVFRDAAFLAGGRLSDVPYTILWSEDTAQTDNNTNGTLVTLTFEVMPTATAGDTTVTVSLDAGSTFNSALQHVNLFTQDGVVSITDCTPGDANGDSNINLMDAVLVSRYLASGRNVTINKINADVNCDGIVDLKDVVLLRHYLVGGWDVELK